MELLKNRKKQDGIKISSSGVTGKIGRVNEIGKSMGSSADNSTTENGGAIVKQDDPIGKAKVTVSALTVRSGSGANFERIGGLTRGKEIQVYEEKDGWLRIKYGTAYGWVSKQYTDYVTPKPAYESWKGIVTGDGLRVRDIPGNGGTPASGSQVYGSLNAGTIVNVLDEQNGWYKIKYDNKDAWICGDYVSKYTEEEGGNKPGYPTVATWNIEPIYQFFKNNVYGSHPYKKAIACGFLGNIYTESHYQPDAEQSKGSPHYLAKGIIQWDGGRRDALYNYCGGSYESRLWVNLQKQLNYAKYELEGSEGSAHNYVKNNTPSDTEAGARKAALYIAQKFERCAVPDNPERQNKAAEHFNTLS